MHIQQKMIYLNGVGAWLSFYRDYWSKFMLKIEAGNALSQNLKRKTFK